jgi:hypothetical protein
LQFELRKPEAEHTEPAGWDFMMDESSFALFLQEQRADLAAIGLTLRAWERTELDSHDPDARARAQSRHPLSGDKALRTRFDTTCRRLADAYMSGSLDQRTQIRDCVRGIPGVRDSMRIPFTEIRMKMDAARFRLALIYESIRDLGDDTRDTVMTLDNLTRAARIAGIDSDPFLKEVAAVSSDVDEHGMGAMRELLLARATGGGARIRCGTCGRDFASDMACCPFCNRSPGSGETKTQAQSDDAPEFFVAEDESPIYLPTHKLIGYLALSFSAALFVGLTIVQVMAVLYVPGHMLTTTAQIGFGVQVALFCSLWFFRFDWMVKKYSTKRGRSRIAITSMQMTVIIFLVFGAFVAVVFSLAAVLPRLGF